MVLLKMEWVKRLLEISQFVNCHIRIWKYDKLLQLLQLLCQIIFDSGKQIRVKQGYVLSTSIGIVLINFVLRSTRKAMGEHRINWGSKTFLVFDYPYHPQMVLLSHRLLRSNI